MNIPGFTCTRCDGALYPHIVRAGDDGLRHVTCPARTCGECTTPLGHKATLGYCGRCYDRLRRAGRIFPREVPSTPLCARCGVPGGRWCDDCLDVLTDLRELGRWVA